MPHVIHGSDRRLLEPGRLLFDDADELSVVVPASCKRTGRCHECLVEVKSGGDQLSPRTAEESFLGPGFRLACQATIERADEDLEFVVLRRRLRILMAPDSTMVDVDPVVRAVDGRVVRDDGEDLGPVMGRILGLAIDIGTTTVVLEIVDLDRGTVLAAAALENPQRFGGSDVMTRISYDSDVPGELRQALRRALNHELKRLYHTLEIDRRQVVEVLIVGNPTMRDLFFDLDVRPIGTMPYRSTTEAAKRAGTTTTTSITRLGHELGMLVHPRARITGGPLVSGHVGADAAADLIAVAELGRGKPFLIVDIGTNSEVIASDGERILAASGPAGPAFEGGGIRYGMPGADGAIEAARLVGGVFDVRTIGDAAPEGICGSGLVDLLAELRRAGRMSSHGSFPDKATEVTIVAEPRITLSRADVGNLAVAKAATAVGQRILLRRLGLRVEDLDRVYLAGGFANALDIGSAVDIGLLVPAPVDRIVRAGNASVAGARALLLSRRRREELEAAVARIEHVELETAPDFFGLFTDACLFEPIAA